MKTIKIKKKHVQKLIAETLGGVLREQGNLAAKRKEWREARKNMVAAGQALDPKKKWNEINKDDGPAWQARLKAREAYRELQKAKGQKSTSGASAKPQKTGGALGDAVKKTGEEIKSTVEKLKAAGETKTLSKLLQNSEYKKLMDILKNPKSTPDEIKKAIEKLKNMAQGIEDKLGLAGVPNYLKPGTSQPSWAEKGKTYRNVAPEGCMPIWDPMRRKEQVFLEKGEKEEIVFYEKYPNRAQPDYQTWVETLRTNVRLRERTLVDWASRYAKVKSGGKLGMTPNRFEAMIRSSGTIDKEGLKKMRANVQKMIDCEIASFQKTGKAPDQEKIEEPTVTPPVVSPTKGAGGRGVDVKPEPAPKPRKPRGFAEAINTAPSGTRMSIRVLKDVDYGMFTVMEPGKVYNGVVKGNNITIDTDYGRKTKSKTWFVEKIQDQGGEPCTIVDCNRSTISSGGQEVTFASYLSGASA